MWCLIRHPDVTVPGICPEASLELQRARGWYRVSDWASGPDGLVATADVDLDAEPVPDPEPQPADEPAPTKAAKATPKKEQG